MDLWSRRWRCQAFASAWATYHGLTWPLWCVGVLPTPTPIGPRTFDTLVGVV